MVTVVGLHVPEVVVVGVTIEDGIVITLVQVMEVHLVLVYLRNTVAAILTVVQVIH